MSSSSSPSSAPRATSIFADATVSASGLVAGPFPHSTLPSLRERIRARVR